MFISDNIGINEKGNMTVAGHDCASLAESFGTPLYIMDEDKLRENMRAFRDSISACYNGNGLVCYASKALCCREMCRIAASEGLGLDVVSGAEIYTAMSVGFDASKICFHGNSKTDEEIRYALKSGVGRIVADNITELHNIDRIAGEENICARIMLRIKPGIDAHTHDFVKTGQIDSKFGLALETGEAFEAVREAISHKNLRLLGVHCHIGSQIFDVDPFEEAARVMLSFIAKVRDELQYELEDLNLGGGFGIRYVESDNPKPFGEYLKRVSTVIHEECARLSLKAPFVIIEPGRSIAGSAGVTLYKVSAVKNIPGIRTYVLIDGGMCDNPRYALYKSQYMIDVVGKAGLEKTENVTVGGKCCETGDFIGENMPIQKVEPDDIIAVHTTGAYNYSMSSNYNRTPRPAIVFVSRNGEPRVAVKRESYEDIIRNDI